MLVVALFMWGLAIGAIGTLVGAGGGFLAVPLLLLLFKLPHTAAVGTSLVMVTANALVGTLLYIRQGKVDVRSGLLFALAGYPGTILGTLWTTGAPADLFQMVFGVVLLGSAFYLLAKPPVHEHGYLSEEEAAQASAPTMFRAVRMVQDSTGAIYRFAFSPVKGVLASFGVAGLASALGIGGGVVLVPVLIMIGYPAHLAAATSQFVLLLTASGAASLHIWHGTFDPSYAAALALGAACGSPLGARLSTRISGRTIAMILGVCLLIVGVRLLW